LQWSLRCGALPFFLLPVHHPEGGGGVESTGVEATGVEATGVEASPVSSLSVGISLLTLIIRGAKNELIIEEPEQANTPTVSNIGSAIYINKYFSKS